MQGDLIERLRQWPSCPADQDPLSSAYVGKLLTEAADRIEELQRDVEAAEYAAQDVEDLHT